MSLLNHELSDGVIKKDTTIWLDEQLVPETDDAQPALLN